MYLLCIIYEWCFSNFLSIFPQMTGKDKDYRYMATSDLLNELSKATFKADPDLELKLKNIIIQQLDDAAGDVSGLAVKWYCFSQWSLLLWIILLQCTSAHVSYSIFKVAFLCMALLLKDIYAPFKNALLGFWNFRAITHAIWSYSRIFCSGLLHAKIVSFSWNNFMY